MANAGFLQTVKEQFFPQLKGFAPKVNHKGLNVFKTLVNNGKYKE
jgi:hypothetical protein